MPANLLQRLADGRTDLVLEHLAAGGAPTVADARGTTLLQWCAHHGDVTALRCLLDAGATLDGLGADRGLRGAAFHGHWPLCQFLLEHGAEANAADPVTGETPLHAALCKANRPIYDHVVRVLLGHGADPNHQTVPGQPTDGFMRDVRTRGETPLHRAAAFGTEAAVRMLIAAGGRLDVRDVNGDTPLSWASWHLRPPAVLRLLCHGDHRIHPDNRATYDHGAGWGQMDAPGMGRPHLDA